MMPTTPSGCGRNSVRAGRKTRSASSPRGFIQRRPMAQRVTDRRQAGENFQQLGFLARTVAEVGVDGLGDLAAMLAD